MAPEVAAVAVSNVLDANDPATPLCPPKPIRISHKKFGSFLSNVLVLNIKGFCQLKR